MDMAADSDLYASIRALLEGQYRLEQAVQTLKELTETRATAAYAHCGPVGAGASVAPQVTNVASNVASSGHDDANGMQEISTAFRRVNTDSRTSGYLWLQVVELRQELKSIGNEATFRGTMVVRDNISVKTSGRQARSRSQIFEWSRFQTICAWFVLSPTSWPRYVIDCLSLLILGVELVAVPYFFAFDTHPEGFSLWLTRCACGFWTFDMLANFRTGYYAHGDLEMRPRRIASQYLKSSFALDLTLVILDVVQLLLIDTAAASSKMARILKVARFFRLTNILRSRRLNGLLNRIFGDAASRRGNVFRFLWTLLKAVLFIAWINHFVACAWIALGQLVLTSSDTGSTWLDLETGSVEGSYESFNRAYQYSTAMHWSLSQMTPGSMQVFPVNTAERVFNIVVLLAGMLVFSTLISTMSGLVMQFNMKMQSVVAKMEQLNDFMASRYVSSELRAQVREQARARLQQQPALTAKNVEVLDKLSLSLRNLLQLELYNPYLLEHPVLFFLSRAHRHHWEEICRACLDTSMLVKSDTLFLAGAEAVAMHVVTMGSLRYTIDPQYSDERDAREPWCEVESNRCLSEAALWSTWRHTGHAEIERAASCEVLHLHTRELLSILAGSARIREKAVAYARSYVKFLVNSVPPVFTLPSDLDVPFEADEVIAAMPKDATRALGLVALEVLQESSPLGNMLTNLRADKFDLLKKEVNQGGSTLLVTARKQTLRVRRCVPLVVLRLTRLDGRLLVRFRLISAADGSHEATCELPGGKQGVGEHPKRCLGRLLGDKLSPLKDCFENLKVDRQADWEYSKSFGVLTRYVRTVINAEWVETEEVDSLQQYEVRLNRQSTVSTESEIGRTSRRASDSEASKRSSSSSTRRQQSAVHFQDISFYKFPDGQHYSWLPPHLFEFFSSTKGRSSLLSWLWTLDLDYTESRTGPKEEDASSDDHADESIEGAEYAMEDDPGAEDHVIEHSRVSKIVCEDFKGIEASVCECSESCEATNIQCLGLVEQQSSLEQLSRRKQFSV